MFKISAFLTETFGTPGDVVAFCRAARAPRIPTEEAVKKWIQRNSMPGEWLGALLALYEAEYDEPPPVAEYLERRR